MPLWDNPWALAFSILLENWQVSHGGDKKVVQMPRGIGKNEGKLFESRLIQKIFKGKLSQQTSSDLLEQVCNNLLSEMEPGFFEVKNMRISNVLRVG